MEPVDGQKPGTKAAKSVPRSPPKSPSKSPKSPVRTPNAQASNSPPTFDAQNTLEPDVSHLIDANDEVEDEDEGFAEPDRGSAASTSVSSSVRDYVFENNRRYHKFQEGRYLIPNDEPEQEREDMKHAMIVSVCDGKLHFAPVKNPQAILDVGTGTGIWAVDMGDEYPEAEVIGIDLSPIQPNWVPPNVRFLVDDAEADWVFDENSLDLVHARHVCMAIKNWPRLIQQAYTALKPGGWIELQEIRFVVQCDDDSLPSDYGYGRFVDLCMEGFRTFGVNPLSMERNPELLRAGGFEQVEEQVWKVPIGSWARDPTQKIIGLYNRSMLYDALQAISMAPLTRGLRWSAEEVELFLVEVRKSLMDVKIHSYLTFHAVYGRKPLSG